MIRAHVEDISGLAHDGVVVDTNVLLYVFGDLASTREREQQEYAKALSAARRARKRLIVDFVIISELTNRILRIAFGQFRDAHRSPDELEFKRDFRGTSEYKEAAHAIGTITVPQILELCRCDNAKYTAASILKLSAQMAETDSDLTDLHIAYLAQENQAIVLTNDADFASLDVDVVSANPKLSGR